MEVVFRASWDDAKSTVTLRPSMVAVSRFKTCSVLCINLSISRVDQLLLFCAGLIFVTISSRLHDPSEVRPRAGYPVPPDETSRARALGQTERSRSRAEPRDAQTRREGGQDE